MLVAGFLAVTLPLVGFVSLLLREQLDPQFHNHQAHFLIFGAVGAIAFALGYAAGEAANRAATARAAPVARVHGHRRLHGPPRLRHVGVLFSESRAGFQVAIPVGLLVSAFFAAGSAFVDSRPELGRWVMRHRASSRRRPDHHGRVVRLDAGRSAPVGGPNSEAATGAVLAAFAIVGP